jgi:hypothetical protein
MISFIISFLIPFVLSTTIFGIFIGRATVAFGVVLEKDGIRSLYEDQNAVRLAEAFIGPLFVLYLLYVGFLMLTSITLFLEGGIPATDYEASLFVALRNLFFACLIGTAVVFMMMRSKKVFIFVLFASEPFFKGLNNKDS